MKSAKANEILENVKAGYDKIADQFSETRNYNWEELKDLTKLVSKGDSVLDAGCGNGRLYELLKGKKVDYWGIDNSKKLIEIAQKKHPGAKFMIGSLAEIDFPDNSFNKIFCVAVLHHIPTRKLQLKVLKNLKKGMKKEAKLILTVWNLYQTKFKKYRRKAFYDWLFSRSGVGRKDCFIPWKDGEGEPIANRFVHAFSRRELISLAKEAGLSIEDIYYVKKGQKTKIKEGYNLCLIAKV